MVPIVSVTGFVWILGGIRGRIGEVLSSRDPRGGEEVGAFDAIDSKLPLAFRLVVPEPTIRDVFEGVAVKPRVSSEQDMYKDSGQPALFHRRVKNSTQDGLFWHTTDRNTACTVSIFA